MNDKLQQWMAAQEDLKVAKQVELECRIDLISDMPVEIGVSTHLFKKDGFELQITRGVTRKIDNEKLSEIMDDLTPMEKAAIVFKPAINLSVYKQLPLDNELHLAVTVKPSLPSLKVKRLKAEES